MSITRRTLLQHTVWGGVLLPSALASAAPALAAPPDAALGNGGLLPDRLVEAGSAVYDAVAGGIPGAVLLVGRGGTVALQSAFGYAAVRPDPPRPADLGTIYDLASLTKVVATTTAVMLLWEAGRIDLDAPVARVLPALAAAWGGVTPRHLLTHTAGLVAGGSWAGKRVTLSEMVAAIVQTTPRSVPGATFRYSDYSAILLGALVEAVAGQPLDTFCRARIWEPLNMTDTGFTPDPARAARCAATTSGDDTPQTRGIVHDPTARALGGVAGNAGLFSTAADLARFCQMLLGGGEVGGVRVLKAETVQRMIAPQVLLGGGTRALGWDLTSPYSIRGDMPPGSFGHTGFTGTSLWLDPMTQTFIVLLTNSVHAARAESRNAIIPLRRRVSSLVASAIPELGLPAPVATPATPAPVASRYGVVRTGLEMLAASNFAPLKGRRVGIVCNHTALTRERVHIADLVAGSGAVNVVALFGPEHSIRGTVDASEGDSRDTRTGLPVYSLYNLQLPREKRYRPTADQLRGIDTLVFDIQDIGTRYYTYIATLGYCLEAAAQNSVRVVVLDRPNPLGGELIEGPLLDPAYQGQFTAYHTMPITHGMTVGELANLFNAERKIGADITVVKMEGWERGRRGDQTGLPWVNPSPNIRNIREIALYPGVGFLETLPLSVGRGTDTPFEVIGAPSLNATALAADLNGRNLPGVSFVATAFTPTASVYKGQACQGVQINLWNRDTCPPSALGIHLADALVRNRPGVFDAAALAGLDHMVGASWVSAALLARTPPAQIIARWQPDVETWRTRRRPFLLY